MRILILVLGAVLVLYATVLAVLYIFQRRLLFIPDTTVPDPVRAGLPVLDTGRTRT